MEERGVNVDHATLNRCIIMLFLDNSSCLLKWYCYFVLDNSSSLLAWYYYVVLENSSLLAWSYYVVLKNNSILLALYYYVVLDTTVNYYHGIIMLLWKTTVVY